jgi:hypothetical protein
MFDSSLPGHCYDIGSILKASGAFNTASDFIILLLPFHAVHKLQMKTKKKVLVILVFTFGLWYALTTNLVGLFSANIALQCTRICHNWICGSAAEKLQQRHLVGPAHYSLMGVCLSLLVSLIPTHAEIDSQPCRAHERKSMHQLPRNGPAPTSQHQTQQTQHAPPADRKRIDAL